MMLSQSKTKSKSNQQITIKIIKLLTDHFYIYEIHLYNTIRNIIQYNANRDELKFFLTIQYKIFTNRDELIKTTYERHGD